MKNLLEKKRKISLYARTLSVLLAALVVVLILSSCSRNGATTLEASPRVNVTAEFLDCLIIEFDTHQYGDCTDEVVKDWITQNAPNNVLFKSDEISH